ncbi:MAG: DNA mismatch repair endonuclease MutL [Gemmataceae bacterium]|nr:DNA mismatch repair endonuclease MutL [Gemmataceae bacterium]
MGRIQILPPEVVTQIAAGEVIERPASVVKELLENAVDAGAGRIDVEVEAGGIELIRVVDNGCGMAADDLPLAFAPHATSKLRTAADLYAIRTLGFRGEALASIGGVAHVLLQSRARDANEGAEIRCVGGQLSDLRPWNGAIGTRVEVRHLFYNVPVRKKFLKSVATELGHIAEAVTRLSLAQPHLHLTLRHNGKLVYDVPTTAGLRERLTLFFGAEVGEALYEIDSGPGPVRLWGYVADPRCDRGHARLQYLFINGRWCRDRTVAHALQEAYRGLLLTGRFPIAFLYLSLPPDQVDVNVHPTKAEVRFRDNSIVFSLVRSTIRRRLQQAHLVPTWEWSNSSCQHTRQPSSTGHRVQTPPAPLPAASACALEPGRTGNTTSSPTVTATASAAIADHSPLCPVEVIPRRDGSVRREQEQTQHQEAAALEQGTVAVLRAERPTSPGPVVTPTSRSPLTGPSSLPSYGSSSQQDTHDAATPNVITAPACVSACSSGGSLQPSTASGSDASEPVPSAAGLDTVTESSPAPALQIQDTYIVLETPQGMLVIDQHALHERILFEQLRQRWLKGALEVQALLVPEPLELTAEEAALLLDVADVLKALGVEISDFGGNTILIQSYPALFGRRPCRDVIRGVLDYLLTHERPPSREHLLYDLMATMSCKAAIKAGDRLTAEEIAELLRLRSLADNSHHCPHGRPTAVLISRADLDRQFRRT